MQSTNSPMKSEDAIKTDVFQNDKSSEHDWVCHSKR